MILPWGLSAQSPVSCRDAARISPTPERSLRDEEPAALCRA